MQSLAQVQPLKVQQIDYEMQKLQEELKELEQNYGIQVKDEDNLDEEQLEAPSQIIITQCPTQETPQIDSNKPKPKKVASKSRYQNLPSVQKAVNKKLLNGTQNKKSQKAKEMSLNWKQTFNEKPNRMEFFCKQKHQPVFFDSMDFDSKLQYEFDDIYFKNFMKKFAIDANKVNFELQ